MIDINQEDTIMQNKFIVFCLFIVICLNIYFSSVGFFNPLLDHYAFRQTQTAISAYYYLKDGFTLNYITPVFGAPWSIPFEFPTYQFIVAGFSYLTTIPLEAAGRLISIVFFYLALCYIYKILLLYYFDKILSLIPIIFLLVCPQYIFWSRTFMIEATALFFCVGHFYYLLKLKQEISFRTMALCLFFGVLGSLTKITTYIVVMVPAGVYLLGIVISEIRSRNINIKFWVTLIFPVFISLATAISWTIYADHLKNLNPLAKGIFVSSNLTKWNFGTIQQRLSLGNWIRIASWSVQYGIGSLYVLMLLPLWGVLTSRKDRLFISLSLLGFLSGPLIFFTMTTINGCI